MLAGDNPMQFDFTTALRTIFGSGKSEALGDLVSEFGNRALLVAGTSSNRYQEALGSLTKSDIAYEIFNISGEPTIEVVRDGVDQAKVSGCDMVIAIGGGSVIDGGKAIAALVANKGDIYEYLEVIGNGQPLTNPSIPFIAVPTTAGTGSEVTRNAVLASKEHKVKVSLRSPFMLPKLALVDPMLTLSLPPDITATTGMDALAQVLEPFVSRFSNAFTDLFCREGIERASRSLKKAYENGADLTAREDMAMVSLLGGLALANAKLGAVHGFAGPLGGMIPGPHGAICARLLPIVMEVNIRALRERMSESPALQRYHEIGRILTQSDSASAQDGVERVKDLCQKMDIRALSDFGLKRDHFTDVIAGASQSSSMKGNPIVLTENEMEEILAKAL
jgi:alcohol dehydrogenase class IV